MKIHELDQSYCFNQMKRISLAEYEQFMEDWESGMPYKEIQLKYGFSKGYIHKLKQSPPKYVLKAIATLKSNKTIKSMSTQTEKCESMSTQTEKCDDMEDASLTIFTQTESERIFHEHELEKIADEIPVLSCAENSSTNEFQEMDILSQNVSENDQTIQLSKWENNSCWIDCLFETLYMIWFEKRTYFREGEWEVGSLFSFMLEQFKLRSFDETKLSESRNNFHARLCSFLNISFGKTWSTDWLDSTISNEEKHVARKIFASPSKFCEMCDAKESPCGTISLTETEIQNEISSGDIMKFLNKNCSMCGKEIKHDFKIIVVQVMGTQSKQRNVRIINTLQLNDDIFHLNSCIQARREDGGHFYCFFKHNNESFQHDGLLDSGKAVKIKWPETFNFPNILVYVKGMKLPQQENNFLNETPNHHYDSESSSFCSDSSDQSDDASSIENGDIDININQSLPGNHLPLFPQGVSRDINDDSVNSINFSDIATSETREFEFLEDFFIKGEIDGSPSGLSIDESFLCNSTSKLEIVHDVDSVLFSSIYLPCKEDLRLFCFPDRSATIHNQNYMQWSLESGERVFINSIPNFRFATTGLNGVFNIHIFFPRLREKKNGYWRNMMKAEEYEIFYDKILRPSLLATLPQDMHKEFPISYQNANFNSITPKGTFKFIGYLCSHIYIENLVKEMRYVVANNSELLIFKDFFFHIHAKNLKLAIRSSMSDIIEIFTENYSCFEWSRIDRRHIFIDLGLEIFPSNNSVCLWNLSFCRKYLKAIGLKQVESLNWCWTSEIGGARAHSVRFNKVFPGLVFAQMYMCEKNLLYSYGMQHIYALSLQDVAHNSTRYLSVKDGLLKMWNDAKKISYGVRCEYRVNINNFHECLHQMRHYSLDFFTTSESFYIINSNMVNNFKTMIFKTLDRFKNELLSKPLTMDQKAVIATYACSVMRGLISRPDHISYHFLNKELKIKKSVEGKNLPAVPLLFQTDEAGTISVKSFDNITSHYIKRKRMFIERTSSRKRSKTDLSNEERRLNPESSANDIFIDFMKTLWKSIPGGNRAFLGNLDPSELQFSLDNVKTYVRSAKFSKAMRIAWNQRFKWYFPDSPSETSKKQGWKNLDYLETYFQWRLSASKKDIEQLKELFNSLEILPGGTPNDKLWIYKRDKNDNSTKIVFTIK